MFWKKKKKLCASDASTNMNIFDNECYWVLFIPHCYTNHRTIIPHLTFWNTCEGVSAIFCGLKKWHSSFTSWRMTSSRRRIRISPWPLECMRASPRNALLIQRENVTETVRKSMFVIPQAMAKLTPRIAAFNSLILMCELWFFRSQNASSMVSLWGVAKLLWWSRRLSTRLPCHHTHTSDYDMDLL